MEGYPERPKPPSSRFAAACSLVKVNWGIGMLAMPYFLQEAGLVAGLLFFFASMGLTYLSIERLLLCEAIDEQLVQQQDRGGFGQELAAQLGPAVLPALLQAERGVLDRPQQKHRDEQVPAAPRDIQLDGYHPQIGHQNRA